MTTKLSQHELGVSSWFVTPGENKNEWVVARTYDTISNDSETGEILYGAGYDVESTHSSEKAAEDRRKEIAGTMPKEGYTLVDI
jgi:hypothetical protein